VRDETALQRLLTARALRALDGKGFALAGSGAIREHGIVDRLTRDVDLFTNAADPEEFAAAVQLVIAEFSGGGFHTDVVRQSDAFAQLLITNAEGQSVEVDLAVDWREHDVVPMSVGAVLSPEDAVGSKLSALYSRAEVRDFIDVDAIRNDGRFSDDQLLREAGERDVGFDQLMFASQLERVSSLAYRRFEEYGLSESQFTAMKERLIAWATIIRQSNEPTSTE